jgi:ABC-type transport system involved in multi-copper enzyme maturation permease subunit
MATVVERNVDLDYSSVRSRISWGAILAGAAVAMAIYALLMALGVAVGLSVSDDVTTETLGTSAGVWGFISLLIALFIGGWVTTQVTTGESRAEAILYGVVLWATTSVLLIWITTSGTRAGVDAAMVLQNMTGGNQATVTSDDGQSSEERQDAIARAREAGKEGSWWAFAGMLASMVAAIGGALVGPVELTVRRDTRHYRDPHTPVT